MRQEEREGWECCPLPCGDVYPNESGENGSALILRPRCLLLPLHCLRLLGQMFSVFLLFEPFFFINFYTNCDFCTVCHDEDGDGKNEAGDDGYIGHGDYDGDNSGGDYDYDS